MAEAVGQLAFGGMFNMLDRLNRWMAEKSPWQINFLGVALTGGLGLVDYVTGYELSFSIFYLAPIALISWYSSRWAGFASCLLCSAVWLYVEIVSGNQHSHWLIHIWNAGVRLAFFGLTTYLISELKIHLRHEKMLARTDELTQVMNSRAFKNVSSMLLLLATRNHHPTVIGYIDLDNFKAINDDLGHTEGDRVLQTVARTISHCVRGSDVVGRLGGDEFAVFMPEIEFQAAQAAFNRMREELIHAAAEHGWPIGFSIGVATYQQAPSSIDSAIKAADELMYRVKKGGKNNVVFEQLPEAVD